MIFHQDNAITIYNGDARNMSELSDESVQMCVTSPPCWGLRKYKGEQDLIWSGTEGCQHEWMAETKTMEYVQGNPEFARPHREHKNFTAQTNTCSLCGAWRGAYGLEPTPELYVQHSIEILREVKRVLRKDGVVFWNIGDSYAGGKGQSGSRGAEYQDARHEAGESLNTHYQTLGGAKQTRPTDDRAALRSNHIKPKDLCLIPFRVAIAAQEDGWWVRSVIIWSKPNPMPESVKDRPTESHEYILMLTKSANYYWDMEAVREGLQGIPHSPGNKTITQPTEKGFRDPAYDPDRVWGNSGGRNLRSVWTFPTQPYKFAHFATFPEELVERCVKAATPEMGCCPECGSPWERVVEKGLTTHDGQTKSKSDPSDKSNDGSYGRLALLRQAARERGGEYVNESKTLGWRPSCFCNTIKPPVPSVVLDPFMGSGTTLLKSKKLGRRAIGYDTSMEYCQLALERNRQLSLVASESKC